MQEMISLPVTFKEKLDSREGERYNKANGIKEIPVFPEESLS